MGHPDPDELAAQILADDLESQPPDVQQLVRYVWARVALDWGILLPASPLTQSGLLRVWPGSETEPDCVTSAGKQSYCLPMSLETSQGRLVLRSTVPQLQSGVPFQFAERNSSERSSHRQLRDDVLYHATHPPMRHLAWRRCDCHWSVARSPS